MAWFLAISDMPGRPFAVVDGDGALAGCHSTRAAASMQMTALNMDGVTAADIEGAAVTEEQKAKPADEKPRKPGRPWQAPPIAFTTPITQMW